MKHHPSQVPSKQLPSLPPSLPLVADTQPDASLWASRSQWWRLVATAVNFTHKASCAAALGFSGMQTDRVSWGQLSSVLALHVRNRAPRSYLLTICVDMRHVAHDFGYFQSIIDWWCMHAYRVLLQSYA